MSEATLEDVVARVNSLSATVQDRKECADEHASILYHGAVCPLCAELEVNGELRRSRDEARKNLTEFTTAVANERKTIQAHMKDLHDMLRSTAVKGLLVTS